MLPSNYCQKCIAIYWFFWCIAPKECILICQEKKRNLKSVNLFVPLIDLLTCRSIVLTCYRHVVLWRFIHFARGDFCTLLKNDNNSKLFVKTSSTICTTWHKPVRIIVGTYQKYATTGLFFVYFNNINRNIIFLKYLIHNN